MKMMGFVTGVVLAEKPTFHQFKQECSKLSCSSFMNNRHRFGPFNVCCCLHKITGLKLKICCTNVKISLLCDVFSSPWCSVRYARQVIVFVSLFTSSGGSRF